MELIFSKGAQKLSSVDLPQEVSFGILGLEGNQVIVSFDIILCIRARERRAFPKVIDSEGNVEVKEIF